MLLHSDGFDTHAAAGTLSAGDPAWGAQVGAVVTAAQGKFGGNSLRLPATTVGSVAFVVAGVYLAFAGWFRVATSTNPVVLLADSTGALLTRNADGTLVVKDGAGTTRATSAAGVLPDATYAWIEVSYRNGSIVVNKGGAPVASYTGSYTAPAYGAMKLLSVTSGTGLGIVDVDDFIVWDDQGAYFNSFGIAGRRIQALRPDGPGTTATWVPNGATNWQSADAASWAGGVGNVGTAAGQKDRFTFGNLAASPGLIDAVVVKTLQTNTGADPSTIAHVSATGATEASSTPQTTPTSAAVLRSAFYRDPSGAAWTASTVNSNEFGYTLGV